MFEVILHFIKLCALVMLAFMKVLNLDFTKKISSKKKGDFK